ncbi:MAG: methyltransferase domain-containing protein [Planctomycetota bacterium]
MSAFERVSDAYERFGREEPFYAVLTTDEFRGQQIDKQSFYETGRRVIGDVLAEAARRGVDPARGRALDFGSGVGRLTNALAEHFEEAIGVDISSTMVKTANAHRRSDNCHFIVNKRPDLSLFADGEFDFVFSDITIQHVPRPASEEYLREFLRVLRPGGLAVFLVPDGPDRKAGSPVDRISRFYRERVRPAIKRLRKKHPIQVHRIARRRVEGLIAGERGELLAVEPPAAFRNRRRYKPLFYWVRKPDDAGAAAA